MDMDDPWGSPWADEVQPTPSNKPSVKEELGGPKTPIPASSLALQQQASPSPWDNSDADNNDDGFGDWADMPAEEGIGQDGAHDSWVGRLANGQDIKSPKRPTDDFSIAWNDEPPPQENQAPYLAPTLLPSTTEVGYQPSLDPWGFQEGKSPRKDAHSVVVDDPEDDAQSSEATIVIDSKEDFTEQQAPDCAVEMLPGEDIQITNPGPANDDMGEQEIESSADVKKDECTNVPAITQGTSTSSQDMDRASSRPSSSPSDVSHHDEISVESPRTSLDEEPKRPQMPRQVSKVQELVEHFDTLAKSHEMTELDESGRMSSAGTTVDDVNDIHEKNKKEDISEEENDDFGDFGDFEEGQSDVDEPVTAPTTTTANPKADSTGSRGISLQRDTKVDHGPINFNPDVSSVGKIFPDLEETPTPERCFIPDMVPHDSFTSTEERKMWYRISRYGPMRKHNFGDDENYVRVNWGRSVVRDDTLKIVARWIEEDRISGRVVLGGGSKAGLIFGWNDSNVKPASITAAFAERNPTKKTSPAPVTPVVEVPREWPRGLVRERPTSRGGSSSKSQQKISAKSISSLEEIKVEKAPPAAPVANFGWNSEAAPETSKRSSSRPRSAHRKSGSITSIILDSKPPATTQDRPSRAKHSSSRAVTKPGNSETQAAPFGSQLDTIFSPPLVKTNIPAPPPVQGADGNDEDDDWGEMISSPVAAVAPVLPFSNGLRHKKSQSFSINPPLKKFEPIGRASEDQNHRPTVSLDQILMPKTRSPQIASPLVPASGANFPAPFSQPLQPTTAMPVAQPSNSDAWASADFSFFDTAPTPVPIAAPKSRPIPKATPTEGAGAPFTSLNATASSSFPIAPDTRRSREELEQDRIVEGVLKSLPDLSYMMKR